MRLLHIVLFSTLLLVAFTFTAAYYDETPIYDDPFGPVEPMVEPIVEGDSAWAPPLKLKTFETAQHLGGFHGGFAEQPPVSDNMFWADSNGVGHLDEDYDAAISSDINHYSHSPAHSTFGVFDLDSTNAYNADIDAYSVFGSDPADYNDDDDDDDGAFDDGSSSHFSVYQTAPGPATAEVSMGVRQLHRDPALLEHQLRPLLAEAMNRGVDLVRLARELEATAEENDTSAPPRRRRLG